MEQQQETKLDVELTVEEQIESAYKISVTKQKGFNKMVGETIGYYIDSLTKSGVTGNQRQIIKKSLIRAILFAFDHGINITNADIAQRGQDLAKLENQLAAQLVHLKENTMLLLAYNMRKQEQTAASAAEENTNATENI